MGRTVRSVVVSICGVLAILACLFGQPAVSEPNVNVDRTSGGLSTSADTLAKEAEAISIDGLSAEQLAGLRERAEKLEFQAEVNRMMQLIINSLYKNKEIFLRELISNASDALDKIRLQSLVDRKALEATEELAIRIKANKEGRTLHIIDTGIGMSKEELTTHLGTIAKSGTSDFLSRLSTSDSSEASDLIGQFGVGFYSSFLVSKKVMVISKKNDHPQAVWESDSKSFSVIEDPRGETLKRGTEVILFLNEEADDYLQQDTLKSLINKYSQFINFPIYLWSSRVEKVAETPADDEEKEPVEDVEASVEEEKKEEGKTVEKTIWDWVHVNVHKPVWKREASNITDEEYTDLYRALSTDQDQPLGKIHFRAEGDVSFTSVLYIPKRHSGDVFSAGYNYRDRIKLYVHRVFISDAAEELLPKYLGFIVGIVDSDDLPLNVSREMLQQNELVKLIRKKLIRKVIKMIDKMSPEDFEKFWEQYSVHIKLGMIEDHSNRARLSKLVRYRTSKSDDKQVSLAEYVSRMKKDQDIIFYVSGSSLADVKASPFAERLVKKGYEVVYKIDPLDEYVVQSFTQFEGKQLQNVAKEGVKLSTSDEEKARKETQEKEFDQLMKWLKEDALKGKIERAELSERLSDSPCALVATKYGWSGNMERIMRAQAHQKGADSSVDFYTKMPKIMEINPRHPLVKEMSNRVKADTSDKEAKETAELLFHVATLRSGFAVADTVEFAQKIESVMRKNLNVDEHEPVEAEAEEPESDDEKSVTDEELDENTTATKTDQVTPTSDEEVENSADAKDEL